MRKKNGNGGCGFCLHFAIRTGNVDSLPETPTLAQCFFSIFILIAISVLSQKVGGGQKNQSSKKTFFFYLPDVSGFHLQTSSP